jgi:hypothetical protein
MAADRAIECLDEDGLYERYLIAPRTAQRWRASGQGPPFIRLGPRRIVYRISDVERWLAERTYSSLADELAHLPVTKNVTGARPARPPGSAP